MESLIGAILLKAIKDLERDGSRSDALEFFHSEWFGILTEALDLDPVLIREKILSGQYERLLIRAAYR